MPEWFETAPLRRRQTADKPVDFFGGFCFFGDRILCRSCWQRAKKEVSAYAVAGFGAFVRAIAIFLMFWAA
ncbi:hypothetical protein, partial [Rhizobium pisi]